MFSSDKMDIHAAEKFWNEFSGKEEWIINGLSKNPLTVVDFVDALIKPVFPYFKESLSFSLVLMTVSVSFSFTTLIMRVSYVIVKRLKT